MISPRWMVEASAVGMLGIALVAAPLIVLSAAPDDDEPVVRQVMVERTYTAEETTPEGGDRSLRVVKTAETNGDGTWDVQVRHVGIQVDDRMDGPLCPVPPDEQEVDEEDSAPEHDWQRQGVAPPPH